MGIGPLELQQMTMWQYMACLYRWNAAQSGRNPDTNWTEEGFANLERLRDKWNGGN